MLQAFLHGKMSRDQENSEDILTSNIFGLLRYVPSRDGLFPLLAQAEAVDGSRPLSWLQDEGLDLNVESDDYDFWPFYEEQDCNACEPDVVIRVRRPEVRDLMILIEAKYLSGKSSEATETDENPNDQLAREWDNFVRVAERENADPYLIYLTANIGIPTAEIEASVAEYRHKRGDNAQPPAILALSWRQIPEVYRGSDSLILRDLCALAKRYGFLYFHGFDVSSAPMRQTWSFNPFPAGADSLSTSPSGPLEIPSMTNVSQIIASNFFQIRKFNRDTALLLSTADEVFMGQGWSPLPEQGKFCVYSGGNSLGNPDIWLPYRFFRSYRNSDHPNVLTFLAVVIDLPPDDEQRNGTTLLTTGGWRYEQPHGWGKGLSSTAIDAYHWHVFRSDRNDNGQPQWHQRPFLWNESQLPKKWDGITENIDAAVTLGLPIHEVTDAAQLEDRVIKPILTAIQSGP